MTARAATEVETFYDGKRPTVPAGCGDVLVISADGKGIVMRPGSLRPTTAKAAAVATGKLATRLSRGEKRNRKHLAEVGAVYDVSPVPRTPADVMTRSDGAGGYDGDPPAPAPRAVNKSLTASVVDDAAEVIHTVFDRAEQL